MEFKEVKVATLSKEDKALLREVAKAKEEAEVARGRVASLHTLFWERLGVEHRLSFGNIHHIRGNSIYKRIVK